MLIKQITVNGNKLFNVPIEDLGKLGLSQDEIALEALKCKRQEIEALVLEFCVKTRAEKAQFADQYKLAGWNSKASRAAMMLAGKASEEDIALLQLECDHRNMSESPSDLAVKQMDKNNRLQSFISVIDGCESSAFEKIKTLSIGELNVFYIDFVNKLNSALSEIE